MMFKESEANTLVVMRDGKAGSFQLARQYYESFSRLEKDRPQDFNNLCARVMLTPQLPLSEEHKLTLIDASLAERTFPDGLVQLCRPEVEIKHFLKLAVSEARLSRLFQLFSRNKAPSYSVISPFKHPITKVPLRPNIHDNHNPIVF